MTRAPSWRNRPDLIAAARREIAADRADRSARFTPVQIASALLSRVRKRRWENRRRLPLPE